MPISGQKITDERTARGWTVERLAVESGCSYSAIVKYEKGSNQPSIPSAERIADAFKVSIEDLTDRNAVT